MMAFPLSPEATRALKGALTKIGNVAWMWGCADAARPVSGYTVRVASPAELPRGVREAFRLMHTRRPRPAYIEVPLDVQTARSEAAALPAERYDAFRSAVNAP